MGLAIARAIEVAKRDSGMAEGERLATQNRELREFARHLVVFFFYAI